MTVTLTQLLKIVLDKGKQKKKIKEKKTTKSKYKEGEDDLGGWTEVKGSSLSSTVCSNTSTSDVDRFNQAAKNGSICCCWCILILIRILWIIIVPHRSSILCY